ncbi:MAG: DNA-protecting protein DprA [Acidobacteria bacterium]|nr:MAG: DNA-protecting protein DprA [Acidobacteriota bacterium]
MLSDEARGWLRVARCPGLPARHAAAVVRRAGGAARLARPARERLRALGVPARIAARLSDPELDRSLEREEEVLARLGAELLHPGDPRYPWPVAALAVPPPVIAALGDLDALRPVAVAIVGSRKASGYGLSMAHHLAAGLAARGVAVVSGLARGIDGAAHRAALDSGGVTIAVLGTGIDRVYPREHRRLAGDIVRRGLLLSEFPPGAPPLPGHFPRRNRIIAGLSLAVVVVEARARSGSLITAGWALAEGRDVLAVPGRVGDPGSEGPNGLLREGAAPAIGPEDVIECLPPALRPAAPGPSLGSAGTGAAETGRSHLLELFPRHDPVSIDELVERAGRGTEEVLAELFDLEIGGLVEALPGGRYRRRAGAGAPAPEGRPI